METFENLYLTNDFISDLAFKKIFLNIETRKYLCKVISLITKMPYENLLNNIKLLYPEHSHNYKNPKKIMDLLFICDDTLINIEGNNEFSKYSTIKNKQYLSILNLTYGMNKKIIQINLNNYNIYKEQILKSKSKFLETTTYKEYPYSEVIYDVSLPILKNMSYNEVNGMSNEDLEWYLYIFYKRDIKMISKIYENDEVMKGVIEIMDFSNKDFSELLLYDRFKFEKEVGIELGRNEGIKLGRNEGIKLGRNEGIKLGRNEGIKLGYDKGINKGKQDNMISIIKNMQNNLYSKDEILKCTGLNEKEYQKYAKILVK